VFGIWLVFEIWTWEWAGQAGRIEVLPHFHPSPARPRPCQHARACI